MAVIPIGTCIGVVPCPNCGGDIQMVITDEHLEYGDDGQKLVYDLDLVHRCDE